MVGAAPLSAELTLQFQKVLTQAEIGQGYGLTETCTTVTQVRGVSSWRQDGADCDLRTAFFFF